MDDACRKTLGALTKSELEALKTFYANIETIVRKLQENKPSLLDEETRQTLMHRTYLSQDLAGFTAALGGWAGQTMKAAEKGLIDSDLRRGTLKSIGALRKVAELYSPYWEGGREGQLHEIASRLQREINEHPDPLRRVEQVLRGEIGLHHIGYYIVDNKYPDCSARTWAGESWFVGWSDPVEAVNAETALGVIADEAAHWVLREPFTEEKRSVLVNMLRESLQDENHSRHITEEEANVAVNGIGLVLMEGFGHLFIGFPWLGDEVPRVLPEPKRRGDEGTLYYESYRFTEWFHERWREFLDSDMTARDWGWLCLMDNRQLVMEMARDYLEKRTIY
jgi:hypothetical protein